MKKLSKFKVKRRSYPVMRSQYQRKHNITGYIFKTPNAVYTGGTLHYIDKNGKLKHDSKKSVAEVKKLTMTFTEFKKRFYDSENL